jgi:hypothetical protein
MVGDLGEDPGAARIRQRAVPPPCELRVGMGLTSGYCVASSIFSPL